MCRSTSKLRKEVGRETPRGNYQVINIMAVLALVLASTAHAHAIGDGVRTSVAARR